ncbi:Na+/H+ antiporter subunit D [Bacillus mangrovi]|uniref:Na+/H+ antiporter subunit D n=1 Tax=Metabacillus mangrovi TaxID=1491830 RepID=A0A7X2SAQ4_9BACI|nr:Na+/H+ antiporter subunit D [Metabacillus mangrovi]MTH55521.1 Na+/H+ antiporter subunit D [Metabacillus mangrovi]
MSNNLVMMPLLIPLFAGILLIFFNRKPVVQRIISVLSSVAALLVSIFLTGTVFQNGIQIVEIGGWAPPYGIVFVADMYASLLVLSTAVIGLTGILYSFRSIGREREYFFYYPAVQFLLAGVTGAFLTGDLFNLFVFFEVLLMASYVLMVLGGTKRQLRESIKYISVNVFSSALFVIAVAFLYAVTGTLNMADLSVKISENGQTGLITVIAVLFLVVFGMKGAIFPLYVWLPGSYNAPPAAVTALFGALLTKVGVYAITRVYTLIFIHDKAFTHEILTWLAALTILFGVIGSIAYWDVKKIVIYNIITAIGVILFGVAVSTPAGIEGSIYYLLHDMIIKGALFFLAGIMIRITGTADLRKMGGLISRYPLPGWMLFIAGVALAGIPPLSGFIGKLKVIQGGMEAGEYAIAFLVLFSSLLVLYSAMKIFINGFWGEEKPIAGNPDVKGMVYPAVILVALSAAFGLGTEFVAPFVTQAAETLLDPSIYIDAVLKEQ